MNGCRCRCRSCPSQNDSPATSGQVIFRFAFARFTCIRPRHARAMRWYAHCLRAPPLLHHTDANCGNLTGNGIYFSLLSNKYIEDELPVSLAVSARFDARRTQNIRQLNWKFINATLSICSMQKLLRVPMSSASYRPGAYITAYSSCYSR